MKFAICNETFQGWPLEKAFDFAADCGYSGIEIAPFTLSDKATDISTRQRAEVRGLADRAGLEIVGLHWLLAKTEGLHLTSPEAEVRRKTADYLADLARLCFDLGGRVMVFGSPKQRCLPPGVSYKAAMDYATEVFQQILPILEETEVVIALEPLGPEETDFLKTATETAGLIERIGSPQVRLHLDCKAMATESMPIPEIIAQNAALLAHFHANDPNRQGPGFGRLDFLPILEALGKIDYRGWVSVEVFDYAPGIERLARDSMAYMQQCLDNIALEGKA
ncbi:MAG: sugar phosphate isomerase/epimerase family protein [Thermoguttaceae bacterium]|jgi:sugar phosphate isomerase/epimerase